MISQYIEFFGRLHPAVLHLPIGILILAFVFEIMARFKRFENLRPAISLILLIGAVSAIFTAAFGYFLSLEGGYNEDSLWLHQWSGIAVALLSSALYWLRTRKQESGSGKFPAYYMPLWIVTFLLLTVASHFGGTLTHGSDFITEKVPEPFRTLAGLPPFEDETLTVNLDSAIVFQDIIFPILDKNCLGCHNPDKKKGKLLLDTPENILAGGEEGKVLVPGNLAQSSLHGRLILPVTEKKHMPPKGKKPLDDQEINLIGWWISQGADFAVKLADIAVVPENIKTILTDLAKPKNPLLALEIDPPDAEDLQKAQEKGVAAYPLSEDTPFVTVSLSNATNTAALLENLRPFAEQIVDLDLGDTDIDNSTLKFLNKLPHLQKLYLDNTAINDSAMAYIKSLKYLQYLNLVNTDISDTGLAQLAKLKYLDRLYLWNSQASKTGVAQLQAALPNLEADLGFDIAGLFGPSQLKPPVIVYESTLFDEEMVVEAKINVSGVKIHYTLDGTDPTENSPVMDDQLVLRESTQLRVAAYKDEWEPSEVTEHVFVKPRYTIANVALRKPPDPKYSGIGAPALGDLVKGGPGFAGGLWLGFQAEDLVATLDMGEAVAISQVNVSCLEDVGSWIFYPLSIKVELSDDRRNYRKAALHKLPFPDDSSPPSNKYVPVKFEPTKARYVRVTVENVKKNPDWHPSPGGKSWVFVDEILVE